MRESKSLKKVNFMTGMSLLTAAVVALQIICTFVRFGPFSITLALTPILVGGALYGVLAGAYLGAVFGVVVLLTGILGWDGGTVLFLMSQNLVATVAICILKGLLAGAAAAFIYKLLANKSSLAASVCASVTCPIVNTGLFVLLMMAFFMSTISGWAQASGQSFVYYIIFGLCGINFVVELLVNLVLSSAVNRIINVRNAQTKNRGAKL